MRSTHTCEAVRSIPSTPRPVLLNIWEAVYFDHDFDTLRGLADIAASCGVERFVVDDGWFHSRRSDNAGLGDWWVDTTVWTNGLTPLIDHVRGLGMQFGIWVEPEMVNPDSDLYRAHPEWTLVDDRYPAVMARNQLVLDLGRPEVCEYLFEHLHALLRDHDIAYVKWDMNRDLVAPTSAGRSGVHRQTLGVYALFDALRVEHPGVEFETCAGRRRPRRFRDLRTHRPRLDQRLDRRTRPSADPTRLLAVVPARVDGHPHRLTGRAHDGPFASSRLPGDRGDVRLARHRVEPAEGVGPGPRRPRRDHRHPQAASPVAASRHVSCASTIRILT